MFALLKRVWSALRSVFRRKERRGKKHTAEEVEEALASLSAKSGMCSDDLVKFADAIAEAFGRPIAKKKDLTKEYLTGNLKRYQDKLNMQWKKARTAQALAMHHPRKRVRKKNLRRLSKEIAKMLPLYHKTEYYTIIVRSLDKGEHDVQV